MSAYNFSRGFHPATAIPGSDGKTFVTAHLSEDLSILILEQNNGFDSIELNKQMIIRLMRYLLDHYEQMR